MEDNPGGLKTLIAVLAGYDSIKKNNDLVHVFYELYDNGEYRETLKEFHFLFTGGTFNRVVMGKADPEASQAERLRTMRDDVREFLLQECGVTVLPDRKNCGVTILANTIVERQCSVVWSFLSPLTTHWLSPEYRALNRLSDLWDVKRLVNGGSVKDWFRNEAVRDAKRNPQKAPKSPLKLRLGSRESDGAWPVAVRRDGNAYDEVSLPLIAHDEMKQRMIDFAIQYEDELCSFNRVLTTGRTGEEVENACRTLRDKGTIRRYLTGPKGGDIEIATEILFDRCHIVVFFIDPLRPHAHIDDIMVVFAACMAEIEGNDVRLLTNELHAREWMEEAVRRHR